jgi:hypothetical protein
MSEREEGGEGGKPGGLAAVRTAAAAAAKAGAPPPAKPSVAAAANPETGEVPPPPPAAAPAPGAGAPAFDEIAFCKALQACNDVDALDVLADRLRDLPGGAMKTRVGEVYEARRKALA